MNSRDQFEQFIIDRDGAIWITVNGDLRSYNEPIERDYSAWQASRACATPEWEHAPDWANWLAMDPDGRWYWHEKEPEAGVVRWRNPWGSRVTEAGWTLGRSGWTETLEQRP